MPKFSKLILRLFLCLSVAISISIPRAHGLQTAFATPQPYSSFEEIFQPWVSGADVSLDHYVNGVRVRIAFPSMSPGVIQTDNELGAGVAVYTGNLDDSVPAGQAGIDFDSYGFVSVNSQGTISLVSSAWIICEWLHCPSPYVSATLSSCSTGQAGGYPWSTCHNESHWQLFADRFMCSTCSLTDNYLLEMRWYGSAEVWAYYRNDVLMRRVSYVAPSDWLTEKSFKTGSGTSPNTVTWFHQQFGVTSIYPLASGSFQVSMENPQIMSLADGKWYQMPHVEVMQGGVAFIDGAYHNGGADYVGVAVTGSSSDCYTRASFSYGSGSTTQSGTDLWSAAGCSSGGVAPSAGSPYFMITANPNAVNGLPAGTSSQSVLTIASVNGYFGAINLATHVPLRPYGTSETLNPVTVTVSAGGTAQSILTMNTDYSTANSYAVTVSGTDGLGFDQLTVPVWLSAPPPPPSYVFPAIFGGSGSQLTVCAGRAVSVTIVLNTPAALTGTVSADIRRDFVASLDDTLVTLSKTVNLVGGNNLISLGSFTPLDISGSSFREYFLKVYWAGQVIYDPQDPNTREWVQTRDCSGGGGGSVPYGSLITLADGSKVPVQDIGIGSSVIVYDVENDYTTVATITGVATVSVDSLLTLHTTAGIPFRADANPRMRLHVLLNGHPVLMPITEIRPGDQIYNYDLRTWVTVTHTTIAFGGTHLMYDLVTDPSLTSGGSALEYIANGYPDCSVTTMCKV